MHHPYSHQNGHSDLYTHFLNPECTLKAPEDNFKMLKSLLMCRKILSVSCPEHRILGLPGGSDA
jgi:hypothetical protein